jgi:hypothetical protein
MSFDSVTAYLRSMNDEVFSPAEWARANFDLKIFICAKGGTKKARAAGFDLPINLDSNRKELII